MAKRKPTTTDPDATSTQRTTRRRTAASGSTTTTETQAEVVDLTASPPASSAPTTSHRLPSSSASEQPPVKPPVAPVRAIPAVANAAKLKWEGTQFQSSSARRLAKEWAEMEKEPLSWCWAEPKNDNLYEWQATIVGPEESPYANGHFQLDIHFPKEYPFKPPRIVFRTKIYHCNIGSSGDICLDTLKSNWSPALTTIKVLLSICSLLTDPNPHDPLMHQIALQYLNERKLHDETARSWTQRHAKPVNRK